jgi:hypothetical protein
MSVREMICSAAANATSLMTDYQVRAPDRVKACDRIAGWFDNDARGGFQSASSGVI